MPAANQRGARLQSQGCSCLSHLLPGLLSLFLSSFLLPFLHTSLPSFFLPLSSLFFPFFFLFGIKPRAYHTPGKSLSLSHTPFHFLLATTSRKKHQAMSDYHTLSALVSWDILFPPSLTLISRVLGILSFPLQNFNFHIHTISYCHMLNALLMFSGIKS